MTIGHIIECLTAKIAAIKGKFSEDATSFVKYNVEEKAKELHKRGYQRYGN
jgi:DNA-directed RNA polymerase II subunit RPB2